MPGVTPRRTALPGAPPACARPEGTTGLDDSRSDPDDHDTHPDPEAWPSPGALPDDVVVVADRLPLPERKAEPGAPLSLVEAMVELGAISLADTSLYEVTRRVAALAQATVPGADEVSMTLLDATGASTVAFTGDLAYQLDERQYEDGFGPCTDAARQGSTIPLFDLAHEERYPGFVAAARRAGVLGTLSVGMPVPSQVAAGLNIYARGDGRRRLDEASVPVAEGFARYAATVLANAGLLHSTRQLAQQMREAMASRAVIEQAKGVLVARTGGTPDEAFAALVQRSQRQGRKLALVAEEILAEAQGAGPATTVP